MAAVTKESQEEHLRNNMWTDTKTSKTVDDSSTLVTEDFVSRVNSPISQDPNIFKKWILSPFPNLNHCLLRSQLLMQTRNVQGTFANYVERQNRILDEERLKNLLTTELSYNSNARFWR